MCVALWVNDKATMGDITRNDHPAAAQSLGSAAFRRRSMAPRLLRRFKVQPGAKRRAGVAVFWVAGVVCVFAGDLRAQLAVPPKSPGAEQPVSAASGRSPSWLSLGATFRFRAEGRTAAGFREDNDDAYGLSRLLVDIGVKPTNRLRFHLQGQDSRAPGMRQSTPFFRDPFDVRQAYVEIGDPQGDWIHLKAGRHELNLGAQRLVGPLDWGNTARQFDAVKLTLGKQGMSVDVFAASVVRIDDTAFNKHRDGENLHGAYGQLNKLLPETTIEPYFLWKTLPRATGENQRAADVDIYTAGFRFVRSLPAGFDYAMEMARQNGSFGGDDVSAWAGYWILGYTPSGMALKPRFSAEYAFASGDENPSDGKRGTFDQLYPTGHLYHGVTDQIGWRNISDVRGGVALAVLPKVNLVFDFFSFWLADRHDHLYNAGGVPIVRAPAGGAASRHIGNEFDVTVVHKPVGHITVGAGYGYLWPGKFLKQNSPGSGTSFPYLFLNYVM